LVGTISGPFFLLILVTGCLWYPEIRQLYRRLFRIYPPGHCQSCGYNLFANVSGICPECGKPCEPNADEAAI